MSEKRDSDPRPRPWQGRALPTELFSQFATRFSLKAAAKIRFFFNFQNVLREKYQFQNISSRFILLKGSFSPEFKKQIWFL